MKIYKYNIIKYYHEYMIEVVSLLAPDRDRELIRKDTANIVKFEQKLASIMMTIEQQRDFSSNYHSYRLKKFY